MCLCCCSNPEDGSFDDPKSKLLSPETPVKTDIENKRTKLSKKEKKLKKADKAKKVSEKNSLPPDEFSHCVVPKDETQTTDQVQVDDRQQFPPEWNSKAAKFAAQTFVGMGLAKKEEKLKKAVEKSSELNESGRHYRSLSKKLREKQEEKLKNSKLPW